MSAFIYKERASTVATQKLQLRFIHMVQSPLTISQKPFSELNFDIFVMVSDLRYSTLLTNVYAFYQPHFLNYLGPEDVLQVHHCFYKLIFKLTVF